MGNSIDRKGVDQFNLGANFEAQDGDKTTKWDTPDRKSILGDTKEIVSRNEGYDYTQNYNYNGGDLATDLVAKLFLGETITNTDGDVILLDEVGITFGEQQAVKIAVKGHNHAQNPHAGVCLSGEAGAALKGFALDLVAIIGNGIGAWDVPAAMPFANSDLDSSQTGLTVTLKVDHDDGKGGDGNQFVGASYNGMVNVSCDYIGTPVLTTTGWTIENDGTSNGSQAFDTTKISAKRPLAR